MIAWLKILWLQILAALIRPRGITFKKARLLTAAAQHNYAFRNYLEAQIHARAKAGFSTVDLENKAPELYHDVMTALDDGKPIAPETARGFDVNNLGSHIRISWHSER